jgi:hypothetical protein
VHGGNALFRAQTAERQTRTGHVADWEVRPNCLAVLFPDKGGTIVGASGKVSGGGCLLGREGELHLPRWSALSESRKVLVEVTMA